MGDNKEYEWIKECYNKTFEELAPPIEQRWSKLDIRLLNALPEMLNRTTEHLRWDVQMKVQQHADGTTPLSGRQVLQMIFNHFRSSKDDKMRLATDSIAQIAWPGDDNMADFYNRWKYLVNEAKNTIPVPYLQSKFADLLKNSTVLKTKVEAYEDMPDTHPDRTCLLYTSPSPRD